VVVDALLAAGREEDRPRLLISSAGALASLPFAMLGIAGALDDTRLVEIADLLMLPALELTRHANRLRIGRDAVDWPVEVAGVFPAEDLHLVAPVAAARLIDARTPLRDRKLQLLGALHEAGSSGFASAFLAGHLVEAVDGRLDPLRSGLFLGDRLHAQGTERDPNDILSAGDLLGRDGDCAPTMPDRVLVSACSSLGVLRGGDALPTPGYLTTATTSADVEALEDLDSAGEWVGFASACALAGASTIVCTLFDQVDEAVDAREVDLRLSRMLTFSRDPARGLAVIQRQALRDWRTGANTIALSSMCFGLIQL
jgi:hypothetical protein